MWQDWWIDNATDKSPLGRGILFPAANPLRVNLQAMRETMTTIWFWPCHYHPLCADSHSVCVCVYADTPTSTLNWHKLAAGCQNNCQQTASSFVMTPWKEKVKCAEWWWQPVWNYCQIWLLFCNWLDGNTKRSCYVFPNFNKHIKSWLEIL